MAKFSRSKRTVLVTGATGGIGRAVALRFASQGWDVVCHYFSSPDKAHALKKEISKIGARCELLKADFSSKDDTENFMAAVSKMKIDCLINNAGTYVASKGFSELGIDDLFEVFMVNTFAPIVLGSRLFDGMRRRRFGRIVNVSSIAAKYGGSSSSLHYGASKRALEGLTKTLARIGAPHNILVNTVRLGVIDTDFHRKFPKDMKKRIEMIPVKKMGDPKDAAEMIYYLGSGSNNFITNEIITIAGGE